MPAASSVALALNRGVNPYRPTLRRYSLLLLAILGLAGLPLAAQGETLTAEARGQLQERAGEAYPLVDARMVGGDSAVLVFRDSTLTSGARDSGTWMLGSPVRPEELDGCPIEKVHGRRLARQLWRLRGKAAAITRVIVEVRCDVHDGRWSMIRMYYYPEQLEEPLAGEARTPSRIGSAGLAAGGARPIKLPVASALAAQFSRLG